MESRTSPGKKGSVQPISEYLKGVFCRFSLVCRHDAAVGDGSPVVVASRYRRVSSGEYSKQLCLLLGCSCPGFPSLGARQGLCR